MRLPWWHLPKAFVEANGVRRCLRRMGGHKSGALGAGRTRRKNEDVA